MAKESGYGQEDPSPRPTHSNYSSASEDDEAPESVPLVASRELALSKLRAAKGAAARQATQEKERRRAADTLLKTQAAMRKERLTQIVDSLARRPKSSRSLASLSSTATPKRISLEEDETSDNDHQPQRERTASVELCPGERIVHLSSVSGEAARARQRRAVTLARSREALLKLRTAAHRVDASVSMAKRRLGRPAIKFALTTEEATALRARLQDLVHPPRRLKLQEGHNNK